MVGVSGPECCGSRFAFPEPAQTITNTALTDTQRRFFRGHFRSQNNPVVRDGGAGGLTTIPHRKSGAVDNKWVSSTVSNLLILRNLALAFSTECQNHANLFSLFRCHLRGEKNGAEIFENFSVSTETCAIRSTEAISPTQHLRLSS